MINQLRHYLGLIRFSHTLFALPFALLSYAMALKLNCADSIPFRQLDLIGILLCMVFARSAAMGFNRFADRDIDAENPRTARRHLPLGIVSVGGVLGFIAVCSVGFVLSTLLFLPNRIPIIASVPVLLFLFGYSYTKRWTVGAHFWLGMSLMLAPVAAWFAIRPELTPFPLVPFILGLAVLFWTAGFDIIYAAQDTEFDKQKGLFSVPGRYGIRTAFRVSSMSHFLTIVCFAAVSFLYPPFGTVFRVGVCLAACLLIAEHWVAKPKPGHDIDLDKINVAFFQMNVVLSVGLLIIALIDITLN
ncbi:4-hydroxybenzoate octaprenyltransferase [Planctomycetales bacterium]|nr:4-hydroxybenzoate octaprenyltransferase [Planctomycetales bacterium]